MIVSNMKDYEENVKERSCCTLKIFGIDFIQNGSFRSGPSAHSREDLIRDHTSIIADRLHGNHLRWYIFEAPKELEQ